MRKWIEIITLAAVCALSAAAHADEPKKMRTFGDWDVYQKNLGDGAIVCHAVAKPYRSKVFHGIRNTPFATITYQDGTYTFSTYPGFSMDPDVPPVIIAGDKEIPLKVVREIQALTYSDMVDLSVFNHTLGQHGSFTIYSHSSHERSAMDVYSLEGLIKANMYMREHCH